MSESLECTTVGSECLDGMAVSKGTEKSVTVDASHDEACGRLIHGEGDESMASNPVNVKSFLYRTPFAALNEDESGVCEPGGNPFLLKATTELDSLAFRSDEQQNEDIPGSSVVVSNGGGSNESRGSSIGGSSNPYPKRRRPSAESSPKCSVARCDSSKGDVGAAAELGSELVVSTTGDVGGVSSSYPPGPPVSSSSCRAARKVFLEASESRQSSLIASFNNSKENRSAMRATRRRMMRGSGSVGRGCSLTTTSSAGPAAQPLLISCSGMLQDGVVGPTTTTDAEDHQQLPLLAQLEEGECLPSSSVTCVANGQLLVLGGQQQQLATSPWVVIRNIPLWVDSNTLRATLIAAVGPPSVLKLIRDPVTRKSRGHAFVKFPTAEIAMKLVDREQPVELSGRPLVIRRWLPERLRDGGLLMAGGSSIEPPVAAEQNRAAAIEFLNKVNHHSSRRRHSTQSVVNHPCRAANEFQTGHSLLPRQQGGFVLSKASKGTALLSLVKNHHTNTKDLLMQDHINYKETPILTNVHGAINNVNTNVQRASIPPGKPQVQMQQQQQRRKRNPARLFVKDLNPETSEASLRAAFTHYGQIVNTSVARFASGGSKGFGFVSFASSADAMRAVQQTQRVIDGFAVWVSFAYETTTTASPSGTTNQHAYKHADTINENRLTTSSTEYQQQLCDSCNDPSSSSLCPESGTLRHGGRALTNVKQYNHPSVLMDIGTIDIQEKQHSQQDSGGGGSASASVLPVIVNLPDCSDDLSSLTISNPQTIAAHGGSTKNNYHDPQSLLGLKPNSVCEVDINNLQINKNHKNHNLNALAGSSKI